MTTPAAAAGAAPYHAEAFSPLPVHPYRMLLCQIILGNLIAVASLA
jgi:hypothetical protein